MGWPLYLTTMRNRQRCPTVLLVIAPDPKVAKWCGTAIEIGHPGTTLTPLVLGHEHVPLLKDPELVAADPALGVLSALFHGAGEHQSEVVQVGFDTTNLMAARGDKRTQRYYNHMTAVLPRAAREALEVKMMSETMFYSGLLLDANTKGKAEGKAEAVLRVLEAREVTVDERVRARIEACEDVEQLDVWLTRAVRASTADDLFD